MRGEEGEKVRPKSGNAESRHYSDSGGSGMSWIKNDMFSEGDEVDEQETGGIWESGDNFVAPQSLPATGGTLPSAGGDIPFSQASDSDETRPPPTENPRLSVDPKLLRESLAALCVVCITLVLVMAMIPAGTPASSPTVTYNLPATPASVGDDSSSYVRLLPNPIDKLDEYMTRQIRMHKNAAFEQFPIVDHFKFFSWAKCWNASNMEQAEKTLSKESLKGLPDNQLMSIKDAAFRPDISDNQGQLTDSDYGAYEECIGRYFEAFYHSVQQASLSPTGHHINGSEEPGTSPVSTCVMVSHMEIRFVKDRSYTCRHVTVDQHERLRSYMIFRTVRQVLDVQEEEIAATSAAIQA